MHKNAETDFSSNPWQALWYQALHPEHSIQFWPLRSSQYTTPQAPHAVRSSSTTFSGFFVAFLEFLLFPFLPSDTTFLDFSFVLTAFAFSSSFAFLTLALSSLFFWRASLSSASFSFAWCASVEVSKKYLCVCLVA